MNIKSTTKNVRMSLQDRIQELLDEFPDKKKAHLAKFVGISRATPTDWTTGKTKNINGEHAYKVAKFFGGIEPYWIQTGKGPKYKSSVIEIKTMPDTLVINGVTYVKLGEQS